MLTSASILSSRKIISNASFCKYYDKSPYQYVSNKNWDFEIDKIRYTIHEM